MKTILTFVTVTVGLTATARAQLVVFDPAHMAQSIMNTAQEIAQFVQVVNNQVQQIQQLTEQVQTLHHYVDLFGDPASIAPGSIPALTTDLNRAEVGQTLTALTTAARATAAMTYAGRGLYEDVHERLTTPRGVTVRRRESPYRPIAAAQQTTENYLAVSQEAARRRVTLKQQIARTTDALKAASTDAEVQKLSGVLLGLSAALQNTDYELSQATSAALVQDIANRTDAQRQIEAKKEQQHAEFTEALPQYGRTFRLVQAPVRFPIR